MVTSSQFGITPALQINKIKWQRKRREKQGRTRAGSCQVECRQAVISAVL